MTLARAEVVLGKTTALLARPSRWPPAAARAAEKEGSTAERARAKTSLRPSVAVLRNASSMLSDGSRAATAGVLRFAIRESFHLRSPQPTRCHG